MKALTVENLDVRYGQMKAVRGVSFDLNPGEVLALVGANGAGKTTMLRAIAGAQSIYAGHVHVAALDVTAMPAHRRVSVGVSMVPEGRKLFGDMTVDENLTLGLAARRDGDWNLAQVYEFFPDLKIKARSLARSLSGGQQQAVAIGRALMSNPDVLLLDEVSLGLSPVMVDRVYSALQKLLATHVAVVLVEQDLGRAMHVADRVICMLEGRAVLDKAIGDVTRQQITDAYFGLSKRVPHAGAAA